MGRIIEPDTRTAPYTRALERAQYWPTFDPEHELGPKAWTQLMYILDHLHEIGSDVGALRHVVMFGHRLDIAAPREFRSRRSSWLPETLQLAAKRIRTPDDVLLMGAGIVQLNPELADASELRSNSKMIIDAMTDFRSYDPAGPDATANAMQLLPKLRQQRFVRSNLPFWENLYFRFRQQLHSLEPLEAPVEDMLRLGKTIRLLDPDKTEAVRLHPEEIDRVQIKGSLLRQAGMWMNYVDIVANLSVVTADEVTLTPKGQIVAKHYPRLQE